MQSTRETTVYSSLWRAAKAIEYPRLDAFERAMGYAIDREKLDNAARVLACPIKPNAPNWQHGRVIYAAARRYFEQSPEARLQVLDIGTAKGFSALCLLWALDDAGASGQVTSVDVLEPNARVKRNTVAEIGGYRTLAEILEPWPEAGQVEFLGSTGLAWLESHLNQRVHVAFVDGKHSEVVVAAELSLLARGQDPGDLVILDDLQIEGVAHAVLRAHKYYEFEQIAAEPSPRRYAVGTRR